ncbi:MAG: STAS domain-containing protein [Pirellulaceae bacterium]|jgi:anti-sigma B factor antagonist|nr:STAS domain-containing protein [Pirellulaceae bacterium]MDP7016772.1 STAS domain-containing protein [Pirellulaceae bacterium]
MQLPTETFGDVMVVHAPEDISEDHADQLQQFLVSRDRLQIILDLDGAESIDSEGLTALLDAQAALRDQHGDLKISTTNTVNRKIFEITRLDNQFELFDSVLDAVKSFV